MENESKIEEPRRNLEEMAHADDYTPKEVLNTIQYRAENSQGFEFTGLKIILDEDRLSTNELYVVLNAIKIGENITIGNELFSYRLGIIHTNKAIEKRNQDPKKPTPDQQEFVRTYFDEDE